MQHASVMSRPRIRTESLFLNVCSSLNFDIQEFAIESLSVYMYCLEPPHFDVAILHRHSQTKLVVVPRTLSLSVLAKL